MTTQDPAPEGITPDPLPVPDAQPVAETQPLPGAQPTAYVAPPSDVEAPAPPPPLSPAAAPAYAGAQVPTYPNGKPMVDERGRPASPKSRLAAAILAWFLGVFGVHRFYVGKIGTGILMILTLGGFGLWALIDFVVILVGSFRDKEERVLANW